MLVANGREWCIRVSFPEEECHSGVVFVCPDGLESRVPSLSAEDVRRVLQQAEAMRIAAINEVRGPGIMPGAKATGSRI
jgi:hypothetical protein